MLKQNDTINIKPTTRSQKTKIQSLTNKLTKYDTIQQFFKIDQYDLIYYFIVFMCVTCFAGIIIKIHPFFILAGITEKQALKQEWYNVVNNAAFD